MEEESEFLFGFCLRQVLDSFEVGFDDAVDDLVGEGWVGETVVVFFWDVNHKFRR